MLGAAQRPWFGRHTRRKNSRRPFERTSFMPVENKRSEPMLLPRAEALESGFSLPALPSIRPPPSEERSCRKHSSQCRRAPCLHSASVFCEAGPHSARRSQRWEDMFRVSPSPLPNKKSFVSERRRLQTILLSLHFSHSALIRSRLMKFGCVAAIFWESSSLPYVALSVEP